MIWRYALRYKGTIAGAGIALLLAAGRDARHPRRLPPGDRPGLRRRRRRDRPLFNYLLLMVVLLAVATALRFYFVSMLGERVVADIRTAVHDNLLRLEPRFFEENRPSEIASRITSDTAVIEMVVGSTVSVALRNIVLGIGGVIYLFALAPMLTACLLIGIPLIIVPIVLLGRRVRADLAQQPGPDRRSGHDRRRDAGRDEDRPGVRPGAARERAASATPSMRVFATARRRILLRAFLTAIVITLMFGSITMLMRQAAIDVSQGASPAAPSPPSSSPAASSPARSAR